MSEAFGICRLSVVPLRAQAADHAEMVSQLLFGEHYQVLERSSNGKWLHIENHFDGYSGWLDLKQHHSISQEYFMEINHSDYQISTDLVAAATVDGQNLQLILGSVLPLTPDELFAPAGLLEFQGHAKPVSVKLNHQGLISIALKYVNAPYQWGGKSPWGIDCSGFVQQVFRVAGYGLPRDSGLQAETGESISSLQKSQAGDLAFFTTSGGKINHAGIILGDGQIIHASGKVRIDPLTEAGIMDNKKLTHQLTKINRVLK